MKKKIVFLGAELLYESLCLYVCMSVCMSVCLSVTFFLKPLYSTTYTFYRYTYKI